jgi:hypothetical protein
MPGDQFQIQSIPALLLFQDGREIDRIVGVWRLAGLDLRRKQWPHADLSTRLLPQSPPKNSRGERPSARLNMAEKALALS